MYLFSFFRLRSKQAFILGLALLSIFFQWPAFAAAPPPPPTAVNTVPTAISITTPTLTATSSGPTTSSCNYYAMDTYNYTELVGGGHQGNQGSNGGNGEVNMPYYPVSDGSNSITLAWTLQTNSPLTVPVPCTGTYQVYFTLQLQATYYGGNQVPPPAAPTITVYPCVQTVPNLPAPPPIVPTTLVYGALLNSSSHCPTTGVSFTFNPVCNGGNYCSTMTFPFSTQVRLTAGQVIAPPTIQSTSSIAVTGGEFLVYYVSP